MIPASKLKKNYLTKTIVELKTFPTLAITIARNIWRMLNTKNAYKRGNLLYYLVKGIHTAVKSRHRQDDISGHKWVRFKCKFQR